MGFETKFMSRRPFVCTASFAGLCAGLGTCGLAGQRADDELKTAAAWRAGIYSADVVGHDAPFTVSATFSDDAITAIDASSHQESLGVGASAIDDLSKRIMKYPTLDVDAVTGATLSSMSFQQGVEQCAEEAGAAQALKNAEAPGSDVKSSYDTDVCVIGAGGSGVGHQIFGTAQPLPSHPFGQYLFAQAPS